jgi:phage shock protein C
MGDDEMSSGEWHGTLRRSATDRVIAGVCGGIGKYFNIDPVIVRLAFVVLFLMPGVGLLSLVAYVALAVVVPVESGSEQWQSSTFGPSGTKNGAIIVGVFLVAIGFVALVSNFGLLWWLNWAHLWPLALVALGAFILLRRRGG